MSGFLSTIAMPTYRWLFVETLFKVEYSNQKNSFLLGNPDLNWNPPLLSVFGVVLAIEYTDQKYWIMLDDSTAVISVCVQGESLKCLAKIPDVGDAIEVLGTLGTHAKLDRIVFADSIYSRPDPNAMTNRIIQTIRLYVKYYFVESRLDLEFAKEPKLLSEQIPPSGIEKKQLEIPGTTQTNQEEGQIPLDNYIIDVISHTPKSFEEILQLPRMKYSHKDEISRILNELQSDYIIYLDDTTQKFKLI